MAFFRSSLLCCTFLALLLVLTEAPSPACESGFFIPGEFSDRVLKIAALIDETRVRRQMGHPDPEANTTQIATRWVDFYLDHGPTPPASLTPATPGWATTTRSLGYAIREFCDAATDATVTADIGRIMIPLQILGDFDRLKEIHTLYASAAEQIARLDTMIAAADDTAAAAMLRSSDEDHATATFVALCRLLAPLFRPYPEFIGPLGAVSRLLVTDEALPNQIADTAARTALAAAVIRERHRRMRQILEWVRPHAFQ